MEQFKHLSHGILLYNPAYDDTYFVIRFLGGLIEEVRAAIALHHPRDVQEASSLALLQEAELENSRKKSNRDVGTLSFKSAMVTDRVKHSPTDSTTVKQKPDKSDADDKLKALMAFRRKNGLCFKCGEKWGHGHKCPPQVFLHVIEELLDGIDSHEDTTSDASEEESEPDTVMVVGTSISSGAPRRRTMRKGW